MVPSNDKQDRMQGEGDYQSARKFNEARTEIRSLRQGGCGSACRGTNV
jgi:hypothetical protein